MNNCEFPEPPLCLVCEFPPCNCRKCKLLRCQGKSDREGINCAQDKDPCSCRQKCCEEVQVEVPDCGQLQDKETLLIITKGGSNLNKSTSMNFDSILFDIVGITSFLLMATAMFWMTVCRYLWHFAILTKDSGRKVQVIVLLLLVALCCCITFHAIKGQRHIMELQQAQLEQNSTALPTETPLPDIEPPPQLPQCQSKCGWRKKCCSKKLKGSRECLTNSGSCSKINTNSNSTSKINLNNGKSNTELGLCKLCASKLKNSMDSSNMSWTDGEVHKMYQKFKLYSIPAEMKTAPTSDNLIGILSGLYNGISGTLANTLP